MRCLLPVLLVVSSGAMAIPPIDNALDALTRQQDYEARRASSSHPDLERNGDAKPIPPGETLVLMDEEGP
ncbi:MAG TPA: hypothetical protein ENN65_06605, partial [Candidatus Hydrogenedentes bacterium]|nr:hypothetical protein [Candidatus Hydrogenedentota bacterium]